MDFMNTSIDSGEWGIVKMMKRIEQLETRFKSMVPMPAANGDFKNQLKKSVETVKFPEANAGEGWESAAPPQRDELLRTSALMKGAAGGDVDELISSAAKRYGLSEELLNAVVKAESGFNPKAVSPKGAMGLMQLMPGTAKMYGVNDPFDPSQNLEAGSQHLSKLLERYDGDIERALAAYNAGEKAVETYKGVPPYKETQTYIARIMGMLDGGNERLKTPEGAEF